MSSPKKFLLRAIVVGCVAGPLATISTAQAQTSQGQSSRSAAGKTQYSSGSSGTVTKSTAPRTQQPAAKGVGTGPAPKVAGAPGRAPLDNRPARPDAQIYRIPKLSPEMEDILVEWEQKSAKIQRLEGTFVRTTYDSIFNVEKYATGKYCFKYPDQGSFEQKGTPVKDGQKGNRFPTYSVKSGPNERWVCDGKRILKINDKDSQYEEVEIPPSDRGQNIRNSPLPFLFGMKAEEAKLRYSFELNTAKTSDQQIWLKVKPLMQQDLANYAQAEVILDRATCVPVAVKLYDPTGNSEDVYVFNKKQMSINNRSWTQWLSSADPLTPDLRGYKKLIAPGGDAGAKPGTQLAPAPSARRTTSIQSPSSKTPSAKSAPLRTAQIPEDDEPPARASTKGKARP